MPLALASPEELSTQSNLPPQDVWVIKSNERIDTPTDEFGIVNVPKLVAVVLGMVDPSHKWSPELDIHHFEWEASLYPHQPELGVGNPAHFRNIGVLKALVPKDFHALIHRFTIRPGVPDEEVMRHKAEAWDVAKDLFESMREAIQLERKARRFAIAYAG